MRFLNQCHKENYEKAMAQIAVWQKLPIDCLLDNHQIVDVEFKGQSVNLKCRGKIFFSQKFVG